MCLTLIIITGNTSAGTWKNIKKKTLYFFSPIFSSGKYYKKIAPFETRHITNSQARGRQTLCHSTLTVSSVHAVA